MRIAIIGAGNIGKVHAETLSRLKKDLSAICDIEVRRAEELRDKYFPEAKVYSDWRKMLDEVSPNSVHICTPHDLHAEMTVEALKRNINVLCEKPLCISRDQLRTVLEAERLSEATLGVCHQNRYNDINIFIREYLSDKKIRAAHGTVAWKRSAEYYNSAEWRGTKAGEGGGALINQALHTLDLMMLLCGEPERIASVKGNLTLKDVIEVEETIALHCFGKLDYTFFATVGSGSDMPVEMSFKLESGEHVLVLPRAVIVNGSVIAESDIKAVLGKSCYGDGHIRLIDDFYNCVNESKPFPINGEEAAKVVRMILAAYDSEGDAALVR